MSASHRNHHSSSSNHRSASGYTEENGKEPPFTNVSKDLELDRIPPSIKPNIKGYQKMFQDVFVDYHLLASLDGDNHAFIGEDFNIFIAHIPNGITRDGCKEGALLIGNIQFIPYYNNLPIEAAAFVCDDRRTIVIPHLHGINPESFDCIYKWYQNQTDRVGNELQQIEAATKALRAAHASHPPHYYGMNAIEIDNLPRRLSLSGDIQVLRSDNAPSRLLVPDIITKTFEHLCKFYNKKYPYHHTIFGYLCTYEGKGTKVDSTDVQAPTRSQILAERNRHLNVRTFGGTDADVAADLPSRMESLNLANSMSEASHKSHLSSNNNAFGQGSVFGVTSTIPSSRDSRDNNMSAAPSHPSTRGPTATKLYQSSNPSRHQSSSTTADNPTISLSSPFRRSMPPGEHRTTAVPSSRDGTSTPKVHRDYSLSTKKLLFESKFVKVEVEKDGNCLPASIAYHVYGPPASVDQLMSNIKEVREEVTMFALENLDHYAPLFGTYANNTIQGEILRWSGDGQWLGEEFITAAADCFKTLFNVYGHLGEGHSVYRSDEYAGKEDHQFQALCFEGNHYSPLLARGGGGAGRRNISSVGATPGTQTSTTIPVPKQDHDGDSHRAASSNAQRVPNHITVDSDANLEDNTPITPGTGTSILRYVRSVFSGNNPSVLKSGQIENEDAGDEASASMFSQATEKTRTNPSSRKISTNTGNGGGMSSLNAMFAAAAEEAATEEVLPGNHAGGLRRSGRNKDLERKVYRY